MLYRVIDRYEQIVFIGYENECLEWIEKQNDGQVYYIEPDIKYVMGE